MKRRILPLFLLFLLLFTFMSVSITSASAVELTDYITTKGETMTYRNSSIVVKIPKTYQGSDTEFRAAWVSYLIGSIAYKNEASFKQDFQKILDILEYYNCNVIIYHVRTFNQAYYKSTLNKVDSTMKNVDWNTFDPMEYVVSETHKRGMEFHAWLNPYRIAKVSQYASEADVAAAYADYASAGNATADANNIITANEYYQLDPGRPAVREFLVNTCMEIIKQYDIDAIHFDDYFYFQGPEAMDEETRTLYNKTSLSIANFRRLQNDTFIKMLSDAIRNYNTAHNRYVQLGISPSGIYRNSSSYTSNYKYDANGNLTSPVGSDTAGFAHYGDYLYADTKKWIDNEWIDYILPQSYWAIEHKVAPYPALMDWWNAVVKYKKVNLYSGIGLYMANDGATNYSWASNPSEMYNQLLYLTKLENVHGSAVYSYNYLAEAYNNPTSIWGQNMAKVKEKEWTTKAILPTIRTLGAVAANAVSDLKQSSTTKGEKLSWSNVNGAKFYYIYKDSDGTLEWTNDEIIGVVYADSNALSFTDASGTKNTAYGIKTLSKTNKLSSGSVVSEEAKCTVTFKVDGATYAVSQVTKGSNVTPPSNPQKEGYTFTGWDHDLKNITTDITINALFSIRTFTVTFKVDGEVYATKTVNYGSSAPLPPAPTKTGYTFTGWDHDLTSVKNNLTVNALFSTHAFTVTFKVDGEVYATKIVGFGQDATLPPTPTKTGYTFTGWDHDLTSVKNDITTNALFNILTFTVTFKVDGEVYTTVMVDYGSDATLPTAPTKTGYTFAGWDGSPSLIMSDKVLNATWEKTKYCVRFYDGETLLSEEMIAYGESAVAPEDPIREGYFFLGWDNDFSAVVSDIDIHASWESEEQADTFTVQFLVDGKIWNTQTVATGESAVTPLSPKKNGYNFTGWDQDYTNVTSDLTINALFVEDAIGGCLANIFGTILPSLLVLGACTLAIACRRKKEDE